jgi:xanthine/CO dehydrogenase XdhC/CoxF family maturation factor
MVLHVFSGDKRIGKAIFSRGQVVPSGDMSLELCKPLQSYINNRLTDLSGLRIFEFSLDYQELTVRVIGEMLEPPPQLIVFGAGHVGQAVAIIGALLGYDVTVIDDRVEFLTRERLPNKTIKPVEGKYDRVRSDIRITKNTAVVIVTRGHQYDEICLEQVLEAEPKYVGMIGSQRRVLNIFKRLESSGISESILQSVHAPIGLKISAVSPQEIAVAILAEIISVMNKRTLDYGLERRR